MTRHFYWVASGGVTSIFHVMQILSPPPPPPPPPQQQQQQQHQAPQTTN